jgi:hypothetical protein
MPFLIYVTIIFPRILAIAARGNYNLNPALLQLRYKPITVIAFICYYPLGFKL